MDKVFEGSLYKEFPDLYSKHSETGMQSGFQCGNGWYDLIRRMSARLEEYRQTLPDKSLRITTVKMKFNELRIYAHKDESLAIAEDIENLLSEFVIESRHICMECGRKKDDNRREDDLRSENTLCTECRKKSE